MKKLKAGLFLMCILSFLTAPGRTSAAEAITDDEFAGSLEQIRLQAGQNGPFAAPQSAPAASKNILDDIWNAITGGKPPVAELLPHSVRIYRDISMTDPKGKPVTLRPNEYPDPGEALKALLLTNSKKHKTGVLGLKVDKTVAYFKLNRKIKFDSENDPYDISDISVPANRTGQDIALDLKRVKMGVPIDHSYTTEESCTGTRRMFTYQNGAWGWVIETWFGKRTAEHRYSLTTDDYVLKLISPDYETLARIEFFIIDTDDYTPKYGPCIEESQDSPGWDY